MNLRQSSTAAHLLIALPFMMGLVTGCGITANSMPTPTSGVALQGRIHGGQQPVVGAHVYLMQASTVGYGSASVSLLKATSTGLSDSIGAYVLSAPDGSFSISGDYTCTAGTQLYYYVLGGNPGSGTNASASFLAVLGDCANLTSATSSWINEVTTIAAAYALSGFATDATHVASSSTTLAQTGIANAFLNATNLVNPTTGVALATTPGGNGTVPQAEINTLANILAACINSNGSIAGPTNATACYTLFQYAQSAGTSGTLPSETATAAINIAHHPGNGRLPTSYLFGLQSAVASPFVPSLATQPNDFTIAISFSGGGVAQPNAIAIDAAGNAWVSNRLCQTGIYSCVSEFNSLGHAITTTAGYTDNSYPQSILIDLLGNAWTADADYGLVHQITSSGVSTASTGYTVDPTEAHQVFALDLSGNLWIPNGIANAVARVSTSSLTVTSPTGGYTAGGISYPTGIAIDPSGYIWVANTNASVLTKLNSNGTAYSATGYTGGGLSAASAIAIDHTGNIWIANEGNSISEFSSAGLPLSPSTGWTGGGLNQVPEAIAIDGAGNVWAASGAILGELSNAGASLTPTGYITETSASTQYPSIAIDGSGNIWTDFSPSPYNTVTEFIGLATPVVTPLLAGVKNNTLGSRP